MENRYFPEGYAPEDLSLNEYTENTEGLEYAMENGIILEGRVVLCDSNRNLHVEFGKFRGIIPKQECVYNPSGTPVKDIAIITRVGKKVCFVISDINQDEHGRHIVLSRSAAQKMCCEEYINNLCNGDVIDAKITHMERFGAFCDIGCGVVALLPIDCISVSRISHPVERFSCGDVVKCLVKNVERDTFRVTLTRKELLGTWQENADAFCPGETVAGIVRSVEPYGIFVELTPNLAGLAEWCEDVEEGDNVAVYIKSIIPEKMKIKLVIVGSGCESTVPGEVCFFDGTHMDSWTYSPEGCQKEIATIF